MDLMDLPDELQQQQNQDIPDELKQEIKAHNRVLNGIIKKNAPFYKNLLNVILAIILLPFILIYLIYQLIMESQKYIRRNFKRFIRFCIQKVENAFKFIFRLHQKLYDLCIKILDFFDKLIIKSKRILFKILTTIYRKLQIAFKFIFYLIIKVTIYLIKPFKSFMWILDVLLDQQIYFRDIILLFIYLKYVQVQHKIVKLSISIYNSYEKQVKHKIRQLYEYIKQKSPPIGLLIKRIYQIFSNKEFRDKCVQFILLTKDKLKILFKVIIDKLTFVLNYLLTAVTKIIIMTLFVSAYLVRRFCFYPYFQFDKTLDICLDAYLNKLNTIEDFFQQQINRIIEKQQQRIQNILDRIIQVRLNIIAKRNAILEYLKNKKKQFKLYIREKIRQFFRQSYKLILKIIFKVIFISLLPLYLLCQIQLFNQKCIDFILDGTLKYWEQFKKLLDKSIFKVSSIIYYYFKEKLNILLIFYKNRQGQFKKKILKILSALKTIVTKATKSLIIPLQSLYRNFILQIIKNCYKFTKLVCQQVFIQSKQIALQVKLIMFPIFKTVFENTLRLFKSISQSILNQIKANMITLKSFMGQMMLEIKTSILQILRSIQCIFKR